jgi:hypothetical protein
MIANINKETGIPYGVIHGNNVPHLLDDIYTHGDDLSYEAYRQEMLGQIKTLLDEKDVEGLAGFIKEYTFSYQHPDPEKEAADIIEDQDDEPATDADADSVFEQLYLNEHYECDESNYAYTDEKGNDFLLGYLGGAPLIWCIKTSKIVKARGCSPCVPNAGDLDTLDEEGGFECYGVPDEYLGDE